ELEADQREEVLDLDARSPVEQDAERLAAETEQLAAEKEQLRKECVELEERLVALAAQAPRMPPISSNVAEVSEKHVILPVGIDRSVERGFQFTITRKNTFVARVVVQAVAERACSCKIVILQQGARIEVGDDAA